MNKQIGDMTNDELMDFIIELQEENSRYERKLDQLTNNWNELEEYIENESSKYIPTDPYMDGTNATYEEILDKMKEIKNGDNND